MRFNQTLDLVLDAAEDETARAYKKVFETDDGELVIAHLAQVCGARKSYAGDNPYELAMAEGRRQVWLMIQDTLNLDERDLNAIRRKIVERFGSYE